MEASQETCSLENFRASGGKKRNQLTSTARNRHLECLPGSGDQEIQTPEENTQSTSLSCFMCVCFACPNNNIGKKQRRKTKWGKIKSLIKIRGPPKWQGCPFALYLKAKMVQTQKIGQVHELMEWETK